MTNYISSLIRTWVPIGVGAVAAWLFAKTGIVIDEETQAGFTLAFGAAVMGLYYAAARRLETAFPQFGWLLGLPKQPGYAPGTPPPAAPPPGRNENL